MTESTAPRLPESRPRIPVKPLNWLRRWRRLTWRDRMMVIEALLFLGLARATILFIPFKRVAPHLGEAQQETASGASDPIAQRVAYAIYLVCRHTPWDSNCFAQALAGHLMLRLRQTASTLYLGVHKEGDNFTAHAWLRNGDFIVTGGNGHERYTVIARYGWQPRDQWQNGPKK